jgi:hypothetical protein
MAISCQHDVQPTGVLRTFGTNELIVTETDLKGHITYANDVFLRVTARRDQDVLGRAHNVIRHPDMPRGVFKLMWDTLESGQEMFAYICNLAGDGAHYWVFADVTSKTDASGAVIGYHSSRSAATPSAVAAVQFRYAQMLDEERRHTNAARAAAAGQAVLEGSLNDSGYRSYNEWVWAMATSELTNCRSRLHTCVALPPDCPTTPAPPRAPETAECTAGTARHGPPANASPPCRCG